MARLAASSAGAADRTIGLLFDARSAYDVKVLRKVVALRKRDLDERKEEEAILDLYLQAVGEVA